MSLLHVVGNSGQLLMGKLHVSLQVMSVLLKKIIHSYNGHVKDLNLNAHMKHLYFAMLHSIVDRSAVGMKIAYEGVLM